MSLRLSALFSACAAALLTPALSVARTVERECTGPSIQADAALREHYPELVDRLRSQLPHAQVDACAVVDMRLIGATIAVSVSLPDGRTAARDVSRHEDVLPTLQALLLVPEPSAEPEPITEAPAAKPVVSIAPAPRAPVRDLDPVKATRDHGFELSLISGLRAGDGQFGYGAGVLSFIELRRWLIGFQGRADGYRALRGSDPETALSLALLLGRRFNLGQHTLDFTAGPAIAMRGTSFSSTERVSVQAGSGASMARPPEPPPNEPDIGPMPRLLLGARLGFSPHSVFRTFIGVDGELGPTGKANASADAGASGRMPVYTVGVALGATVGTR